MTTTKKQEEIAAEVFAAFEKLDEPERWLLWRRIRTDVLPKGPFLAQPFDISLVVPAYPDRERSPEEIEAAETHALAYARHINARSAYAAAVQAEMTARNAGAEGPDGFNHMSAEDRAALVSAEAALRDALIELEASTAAEMTARYAYRETCARLAAERHAEERAKQIAEAPPVSRGPRLRLRPFLSFGR